MVQHCIHRSIQDKPESSQHRDHRFVKKNQYECSYGKKKKISSWDTCQRSVDSMLTRTLCELNTNLLIFTWQVFRFICWMQYCGSDLKSLMTAVRYVALCCDDSSICSDWRGVGGDRHNGWNRRALIPDWIGKQRECRGRSLCVRMQPAMLYALLSPMTRFWTVSRFLSQAGSKALWVMAMVFYTKHYAGCECGPALCVC